MLSREHEKWLDDKMEMERLDTQRAARDLKDQHDCHLSAEDGCDCTNEEINKQYNEAYGYEFI